MQKLFWKTRSGKVVSAIETPFKSEDEFERYIETAKEVLSDVFILKRQVRAGGDIPDMVGVDRDNYVVIIENKNVTVDEGILPQLLRYAVWAETHPDAIRAMWLEAKEQPEKLEIDWDRLKIRVVALPEFAERGCPSRSTPPGQPASESFRPAYILPSAAGETPALR